jgi:hypothetical protein
VKRVAVFFLLATSCRFDRDAGEDRLWASHEQMIEAAKVCGVQNFQPTQAGVHWAAYVPGEKPDKGPKGDCIYDHLRTLGLQAT